MRPEKVDYITRNRRHRRWMKLVGTLACIVVFCTTYALILPAITMENKTYCGMEEHQHDDACYETELMCGQKKISAQAHEHGVACYEQKKELRCTLEEGQGHTHGSECIQEERNLICTDTEESHVHTEECYEVTQTYICGREESAGHTHTDACYETKEELICQMPETEGETEHIHTEACYRRTLACGKPEHTHDAGCYADHTADSESAQDWEKTIEGVELTGEWAKDVIAIAETQLGYQESVSNYIIDEAGKKKGYTRYGAWFGVPYGDWCAMFASFCIHYAQVEDFPLEAGCPRWIEILKDEKYAGWHTAAAEDGEEAYLPKMGDLIFFDWNHDQISDHVGLVSEVKLDEEGNVETIHTIEGNSSDRVQRIEYPASDERIMGYGSLPENPKKEEEETETNTETETETDAETESETQPETAKADSLIGAVKAMRASETKTLEGERVDAAVAGERYIIYTLANGNQNPPGYALSADDPLRRGVQLAETDASSGYVKYVGTDDLEWVYTENGFCNKRGEYLTLTRAAGNRPEGKAATVGLSAGVTNAKTDYDARSLSVYNTERVGGIINVRTVYNQLHFSGSNAPGATTVSSLNRSGNVQDQIYLARVTTPEPFETDEPELDGIHPACARTGNVNASGVMLYNVDASGGSGAAATPLADVEYTIWDSRGKEIGKVYTSDQIQLNISQALGIKLPNGTYTIQQTDVPDGYVVTPQTRTFTVANDKASLGVFYDYREGTGAYVSEKNAIVNNDDDYANRTCRVDISAASGNYKSSIEPLNFSLVVDQSNSMLFPAGLYSTGKSVDLYYFGHGEEKAWWGTYDKTNTERLNDLHLDTSQLYYIIADDGTDDTATATVYAVWYDAGSGQWIYQDASYYAKAQKAAGDGNNQNNGEDVPYAVAGEYSANGSAGGSIDKTLGGNLAKDTRTGQKPNFGNGFKTYEVYTGSEFNRLHFLQESLLVLINQLAALNEDTRVTLDTFTNSVLGCHVAEKLDAEGVETLRNAVNQIVTAGGTDQAAALRHILNGNTTNGNPHLSNEKEKNYVVMITDGAPNGGTASIQDAINVAKEVKKKAVLATVGLSMQHVRAGSAMLETIATSSQWCHKPEDAADLSNILVNHMFQYILHTELLDAKATVRDVISDSFYPINPDSKQPLKSGDYINLNGRVTISTTTPNGRVFYDEEKKEWYVEWSDQTLPANRTVQDAYGNEVAQRWRGCIYLKAKEDFIGGNAIDTNKSAQVILKDGEYESQKPIELETPNVNVRLLPMQDYDAEATVFLGDDINRDTDEDGIPDALEDLFTRIHFQKIVSGAGDVYNRAGATEADGCMADSFTLPYAADQLTLAQWDALKRGEAVRIDYTYDEDSSHGAVGYFELKLQKEGAYADYDTHPAKTAGKDVSQYKLSVTYHCYGIGQADSGGTARPGNVHNEDTDLPARPSKPGKEVGKGYTLESGIGTVSAEAAYRVSVIDGKVIVEKELDASMRSSEEQKFHFTLYRLTENEDGTYTKEKAADLDGNPLEGDLVVAAGELSGSAALTFDHLPRGRYVVEEQRSEDYYIERFEVVEGDARESTNCYYDSYDPDAVDGNRSFHIGYDETDADVIQYKVTDSGNHVVYTEVENPGDYHDYSRGHILFRNKRTMEDAKVPVQKIWDASAGAGHEGENVYVVLYDRDGNPVCNEDGDVRMLKLNAGNEWKGEFTLSLPKGMTAADAGYVIREVGQVTEQETEGAIRAVLVNDGEKKVYYGSVAQDGEILHIGKIGYQAAYGEDESGAMTVTNYGAYKLPESGGSGTTPYTMAGLILMCSMAASILYRTKKCRKGDRASS